MKKIILFIAALIVVTGGFVALNSAPSQAVVIEPAAIKWSTDLTKAIAEAGKSKKLVLQWLQSMILVETLET